VQLDVAAAIAIGVQQPALQRAVSARTVWPNMRCAPRWRRASAQGRWHPHGWTALRPAEQPQLFSRAAPTKLQGRTKRLHKTHAMAQPGLGTSAAAYRAGSTHTDYGGLLRTGPK
jgi:hypothetical protein